MTDPKTPPKLITDPGALLRVLKRLHATDDGYAGFRFRTAGGLRVAIRNDSDSDDLRDETWLAFDVNIAVEEDEPPSVLKAIKNEIHVIADDTAGLYVIDEFEFDPADQESLTSAMDFINDVNMWTVCPCGDYFIKDRGDMCYFCDMSMRADENGEQIFCPICHDVGHVRWMVTTNCCKQKLHKKCKEACIVSEDLRNRDGARCSRCPMCREPW